MGQTIREEEEEKKRADKNTLTSCYFHHQSTQSWRLIMSLSLTLFRRNRLCDYICSSKGSWHLSVKRGPGVWDTQGLWDDCYWTASSVTHSGIFLSIFTGPHPEKSRSCSVTSSKCMQSHLSYGMCSQLATRESRHFCLCLWTGSGSVLDISVTGTTEVSGGAVNASRMCRGAQWWFVEEWRFNFHPSLQLLPPLRQSLNGS